MLRLKLLTSKYITNNKYRNKIIMIKKLKNNRCLQYISLCLILIIQITGCKSNNYKNYPNPISNSNSPLMLAGDWVPKNTHEIDFSTLPHIPSQRAVVSDVEVDNGVNEHNYLVFYSGKYWIMWSDGPGVEDRVGQVVKYATSEDGLNWSEPMMLTSYPPHSGPQSPYYNTRTVKGFRWIARGFWVRKGKLLALASLDEAGKYFGHSLELRAFRWEPKSKIWRDIGVVSDNTINNFPPKKLPSGKWMMSRRKSNYKKEGTEFLIGGTEAINQWKSYQVPGTHRKGFDAEEPFWWTLPDGNLESLYRDNNGSGYLFRSFSTDNGRTWSKPVKTNFPDATSKLNGVRLDDGRYVLVSDPNPDRRIPLALSLSSDGMVFTKMGYLAGRKEPAEYPFVMQHNDYLFVAYNVNKQQIVVLKISISDLANLDMSQVKTKR
jgi:hypothetical protein